MNASMQAKLIDSTEMFIQLFTELTFLFLAISFLVAIINIKLPAEKIQGLLGGKNGRGYFTAAGLGAITPFCSCSTIPMLIGLLNARAGFGPTMTFLFTSPLLNPIVIALFIPVLGVQVTIAYASLALVTSITAGILLQHFNFDRYIKQELLKPSASSAGRGASGVISAAKTSCCDSNAQAIPETACGDNKPQVMLETACCDGVLQETTYCESTVAVKPSMWAQAWQESWSLFRSMFPYMLIAMVIGAAVHGFVPTEFFAKVASADNPAAVPSAALIGIPLYIRVTALLPLVGSFIAKGVSIGAIIALVIGSGGASLPEMILLKRLFYWPLLLAFLVVIFSMAVIGGYSFNLLFA
jgi:uncharacterized membrane protein YraQ (UPF0718 family)